MAKIPNGAMRLVEAGKNCHAFAEDGDDDAKNLNMTIYSGGIIKDHYWWGDLAIDLTGIKFDRNRYPVLENHRTDKKIAFSKRPKINGSLTLDSKTTVFVDTDASLEFQKTSKKGFPYQASMYAIPSVIERVSEGEKVEVNGFTFKGPGTVWRKCLYQEASVCVFGWDTETKAEAFSKEEVEIEFEEIGKGVVTGQEDGKLNKTLKLKEVKDMPIDLAKLEKDAPELLTSIRETAATAAEEKFSKERTKLQGKIDTLTSTNDNMTERVQKLEKADAKREDRDQKLRADDIWQAKLAASDLPLKRHTKIKAHVKFKDHLDDKGMLDREKFAKAVDAEIKDWLVDESSNDDVLGGTGSLGGRAADSEAQKATELKKENTKTSNALLEAAGQKVNDTE